MAKKGIYTAPWERAFESILTRWKSLFTPDDQRRVTDDLRSDRSGIG